MALRAGLASLLLVYALIAACSAQPPPSTAGLAETPTPSASVRPQASANPCPAAVTYLGAFTKQIADDLASLRPLIVARRFESAGTVRATRNVSAILTAYLGLEQTLRACAATRELAQRVQVLRASAEATIETVLSARTADAPVQRNAAVSLFGLLPEVLALSGAATSIADSLEITLDGAQVPAGASKPIGSLPPLPTPKATPKPTPGQTSAGGAASGSGQAAYDVAVAYRSDVSQTYQIDLLNNLNALESIHCSPGCTSEEVYAVSQAQAPFKAAAVKSLKAHLAFMGSHPAASCFRAAYAADKPLANDWITLISDWSPWGGTDTPEGRYQTYEARAYLSMTDAFLGKFTSYFRTCGF